VGQDGVAARHRHRPRRPRRGDRSAEAGARLPVQRGRGLLRLRAAAAILLAAAAALAGCSSGSDESSGDAELTVYVSLPLHEPDGRDAADGARLALEEAGDGGVRAAYLDDSEALRWSPARAAANARRATEDTTSIAYLGDFESGATRASLPVTNQAHLLQVSPASSADDLVAPFAGSDEVPDVQPTGDRTFGRVIPSDAAQGAAGAGWVDRLGIRRVSTDSDGSAFGDSLVASFKEALRRAVIEGDADFVYYGGLAGTEPRTPGRLLVSDAELGPGIAEPAGTLATSAALAPSQLAPAGGDFVARFRERYGRPPGRYAAYGYEAMAVILDSIDRADDRTDRGSVIDAFFATADRDSILGQYSITDTGETTLDRMSGYRFVRGDRVQPVAELSAAGP
jgi:branched-chain amino acid transport system substrate-binding protein